MTRIISIAKFAFLQIMLVALVVCNVNAQVGKPYRAATLEEYAAQSPFKMSIPEELIFSKDTFDIRSYGAISDGVFLNTEAIKKAINEASNIKNGATVLVPPGLWLTGPIQFKSNVNLHLSRGAVILFTADHSQYPIIKKKTGGFAVMSPIYGIDLQKIAITGEGIVDGSGDQWRPMISTKVSKEQWDKAVASGGGVEDVKDKWKDTYFWWPNAKAVGQEAIFTKLNLNKEATEKDYEDLREYMRPDMVQLVGCKNVLIDGPTFKNSPLFNLYLQSCDGMMIRNINVLNEWNAINSDGIDLLNCKNTVIYRCTVNTGDDGICMKSSGKKLIPNEFVFENVLIADCIVYHAHGGFVIGSGIGGGMRNIYVRNCTFIDSDVGIRLKSKRDRGGLAKNIYVDGVYMDNMLKQAILISSSYAPTLKLVDTVQTVAINDRTPRFENIHISNVYCGSTKTAIQIDGLGEMPIKDVFIKNVTITSNASVSINDAVNINLDNVKIISPQKIVYNLDRVNGIHINNASYGANAKTFISIKGKNSTDVKVTSTNLKGLTTPFIYESEENKKAITIN